MFNITFFHTDTKFEVDNQEIYYINCVGEVMEYTNIGLSESPGIGVIIGEQHDN